MPAKELRFDAEARAALKRGADSVANAVAVTLGPRGRTVVLDKKFGPPLISNDGVTIARDLDFEDHFENMGAQVLKEGVVTVADGNGLETEVEVVEGMQFDRGYVSPYLVTDQQAMEAVLDGARVLVTDGKITAVNDLLPSLELVMKERRPLLIIA